MITNSLRATICSVVLLLVVSAASAQQSVQQAAPKGPDPSPEVYTDIPGTQVSMRVPEGFSVATDFPGIAQEMLDVYIEVNQMSSRLEDVKSQLGDAALAQHGAKLLSSEPATISGTPGVLLHVMQNEDNESMSKWLLLFGDASSTVVIAASAPENVDESLGDKLKQTLLTAHYDARKKVDQFYGLGFTMRESAILEVRSRMPGGVLMTRKGAPDELTPDEPILVVIPTDSPAVSPLPSFAKEQLTHTDQFTDFTNFDEQAVSINGVTGYRIIADAKAVEQNAPVRIFFVLFRSGSREMVLEGIVAVAGWERYLPEFRGMADSFQLTTDPNKDANQDPNLGP